MLGGDPISFAVVFAAGVVSFASPCVLPLVPAYIGFVSGVGLSDEEAPRRRDVALPTAAFVAGFSLMFAALGASVGLAGSALLEQRRALEIAGGILVVAMGLVLLGRGVPMILMRERRFHLARRPATLVGSGLAGVAFATGWTPCIGPTLAAALTIAANGGDPVLGASLLVVYALGLGLPFLLTGLFLQQATTALAFVRPRLPAISMAGAAVLVVFGVLLATGEMTELTTRLGSFGTPL
ncbi:MAG: cytochrome c biogenesis CcdA family protein [Thermoleophilia bacterium]